MCRRRKRLTEQGWTRYTYALAAFLPSFLGTATIVAINGNPTSQLSIIFCVIWIVFIIAAGVALLDRRNR